MLLFSENAFVAERLVKSECPKAVVWLLVDQRQYELTKLRHNFTIGTNCPGYHLTCIRHKAQLLNAPGQDRCVADVWTADRISGGVGLSHLVY